MRKNKRKLTAFALAALLGLSYGVSPVHAQETQASQQTGTEPLELDETAVPMEDISTEEPVNTEPDSSIAKTEPSTEPETSVQENEPEEATDKEAGKEMADEPAIEEQKEAGGQEAEPTQGLQEDNGVQPYAENNAGDFHVADGTSGTDWIYDSGNNTLTFRNSGTYTVTGNGQETSEQINVDAYFKGTITIQNVNAEKMTVHNTAQLTLMLEGANTLRKGLDFSNAETGKLIINSDTNGSLTATGGEWGAGIGGGNEKCSGNNITINSGTIIAAGGLHGAGIGGGSEGSGSNITINGGTITTTAIYIGAGIGGGWRGSGNNITINGGTITATGNSNGAGIGGGPGGSGNTITINGGIVTATGGELGAGIGGGNTASGSNITISGGIVTATGGYYAAGIGGGGSTGGSGSNITISGGTVTATGKDGGAGIGGGAHDSASDIKITGGSVKANSIGATPTDGQGKNVYLIKIEDLSGHDTVMVDNTSTYTRTGNHPDNDGAFYLYLTGENHTISAGDKTYQVYWDSETGRFKLSNSDTPVVIIETKTASSITVKALDNQELYGTAEYSLDTKTWQDSNVFTNLHSAGYGGNYTVYARYKGNDSYTESEAGTLSVSTNSASYTITIPADPNYPLEAGNADSISTISVNQDQPFDLGYNGQVDVKIKKDDKVTDKAELKLTRQNDTGNHTITSALLVNGKALGNIDTSVATFKNKSDSPVTVSFAKPTTDIILPVHTKER